MVRAGMVLAGLAGCLLAGCGGAGGMAGESYRLSILHINDHHSHLDPTVASLMLPGSPDGRREAVSVSLGGFARVGQAFDELAEGKANLLKLHAGDAITGTLYFTLTQGRADAQLMNAVCFDAMAVGNHEFDPGDTGLAQFIEALWDNEDDEEGCRTPVLSANVAPREGSPLGERLRPSVVLERGGERIGVVGLTVQRKTQNSSRPDPGTRLLDEQASAQAAIDALRADGVNKVVLLSHVGYPRDRELAAQLSGVDVVVGGDSHSLLGSSALEAIGLKPVGPYPDEVHNKDGDRVCVVQAWQYAYAVGELDVVFDGVGRVRACEGQVHVLIGDVDEVGQGSDAPFGAIPELRVTALSPRVEALLAPHREARAAFGDTVVGEVVQPLCLRRVPGSGAALSHSVLPGCDDDPHVIAHGGDVQQLVAEAFLRQGQRYGGAEVSIQNGGGVRVDLPAGPLTVDGIYTVLPFANTLVRLTLTGAELREAIEDAFEAVAGGSSGAYPYTAGLRWRADLRQPRGQRLSDLQVRDAQGGWQALEASAHYRVITSDFLADGQGGYPSLARIEGVRREATYLAYADAFLQYVIENPVLSRLPTRDYSTQSLIAAGR